MKRFLFSLLLSLPLCGSVLAATLDGYTLTGVIHDPERVSVAILEHEDGTFYVLREGESIALGRVDQIDRHSVTFERPGELVSMSLEYGVRRFESDGARLLASGDSVGSVAPGGADTAGSGTVSTRFKPEARAVSVRGSADALNALIGSAGSSAVNGPGGATSGDSGDAGGSGARTTSAGTAAGSAAGGASNNAPRELGIALAEVFDLPASMEIVQVNGTPVVSVPESLAYIQQEIGFGNTVTLFTNGILPSSRIYMNPESL